MGNTQGTSSKIAHSTALRCFIRASVVFVVKTAIIGGNVVFWGVFGIFSFF